MSRRLTLSEMAAHLGLSTKTLSKYVRADAIPHLRVGRQMRFDLAQVEKHFQARKEPIADPKRQRVGPARLKGQAVAGNAFSRALGLTE